VSGRADRPALRDYSVALDDRSTAMRRSDAVRFSTRPVLDRLQQRAAKSGVTFTELWNVLGLPRRTMHRVVRSEGLRWDTADRVAVAMGHHPSEIWPEWFAPSMRRVGS
jgi:lambda repressor-like predicted transcriptional regulator